MTKLTVCYYPVTYVFQSESSIYNCMIVKELFAQNRRDIWSLTSLAKWFSAHLQWLWVRIELLSHRGNSWIYIYWILLLENLKVCFVSLEFSFMQAFRQNSSVLKIFYISRDFKQSVKLNNIVTTTSIGFFCIVPSGLLVRLVTLLYLSCSSRSSVGFLFY